MPAKIDNPNMGNNTTPTTSAEETRRKYAEYFEKDSNKGLVSIDTFFQLLLAEMTNQDPLEPTSNTEFVSQLANFTALQTNSDSLHYNTVSYASSLAGKTVTVATEGTTTDASGKTVKKTETGVVTNVDISEDDDVRITVGGKKYALKDVMYVNQTGSSDSSAAAGISRSDGAYAVSLIGKKIMVTGTTADGEELLDEGVVQTVEYKDGEYRVVVNDLSFALDDVIKVQNNDAASSSNANSIKNDGAFAVSLIGKSILVPANDENGNDVFAEGIVESIEIVDGEYRVVVDGFSIGLDEIVSVSNPKTETTNPDDKTENTNTENESTETSVMEDREELMNLFS